MKGILSLRAVKPMFTNYYFPFYRQANIIEPSICLHRSGVILGEYCFSYWHMKPNVVSEALLMLY